MNNKGPISHFIEKHFLHFNAAALVDAAKGYEHNSGQFRFLRLMSRWVSTRGFA